MPGDSSPAPGSSVGHAAPAHTASHAFGYFHGTRNNSRKVILHVAIASSHAPDVASPPPYPCHIDAGRDRREHCTPMIHGIGTDLVAISRCTALLRLHGDATIESSLAPGERTPCRHSADPGRFLALRLAAKEALGKALGRGIRAPLTLTSIEVTSDAAGQPEFAFHGPLAEHVRQCGLRFQLSVSAPDTYAIACVIAEIV